jgi:hypothetical protein
MYSGPLSHRITRGLLRQEMICLSSRMTRSEVKERSNPIPTASELKSSMTLNNRNVLPSSYWSFIKSIDRSWLMPSGTVSASGLSSTKRFRGLSRKLNSSIFVDAFHALVIPFKALNVAQLRLVQAKSQVPMVVCQTSQPVGHFDVLCVEFALITKARYADANRLARHPYAHTALARRRLGYLPSGRWPHHIFSNSFMRDIINAPMPPDLARHLQNVAVLTPSSRQISDNVRPTLTRLTGSTI